MDSKAKETIWLQFQDLLPKTLSGSVNDHILKALQTAGTLPNIIYEAAIYAGWCRGYAEATGHYRDGIHCFRCAFFCFPDKCYRSAGNIKTTSVFSACDHFLNAFSGPPKEE